MKKTIMLPNLGRKPNAPAMLAFDIRSDKNAGQELMLPSVLNWNKKKKTWHEGNETNQVREIFSAGCTSRERFEFLAHVTFSSI